MAVVGAGVFETLKVTEQGAFAVRRHLNRLARSAAA
jgi:branched-chain amino acid aminotransferase